MYVAEMLSEIIRNNISIKMAAARPQGGAVPSYTYCYETIVADFTSPAMLHAERYLCCVSARRHKHFCACFVLRPVALLDIDHARARVNDVTLHGHVACHVHRQLRGDDMLHVRQGEGVGVRRYVRMKQRKSATARPLLWLAEAHLRCALSGGLASPQIFFSCAYFASPSLRDGNCMVGFY